MTYSINGRIRTLLYLLADGIYPSYAIFVKIISNRGNTRKEKNFAGAQEAVRRDVERAFGVLISRWHILQRPLRLLYLEDIESLVKACVILHNMVVECRRDTYDSGMSNLQHLEEPLIESVRAEGINYNEENTMLGTRNSTIQSWALRIASRERDIMNEAEHHSLRHDLIEHLYSQSGFDACETVGYQ